MSGVVIAGKLTGVLMLCMGCEWWETTIGVGLVSMVGGFVLGSYQRGEAGGVAK